MPRNLAYDPTKGVLEVDWALFGELSRSLALKVAREFDPEIVIGIANAGVVPGATVAAILDCEFHSMLVTRHVDDTDREMPGIFGAVPRRVLGKRVLVVDETCDSGDTLRLVTSAVVNAGASVVRSAVSFRTGRYEPDFHAIATESMIVLPWDREILVEGRLVLNPKYSQVFAGDDSPYAEG